MLNHVIMKEVAMATFEIDKEKTNQMINALDNASKLMNKEDKELYIENICALLDLMGMLQSIESDFRK
jgi:hypothetical protein